MMIFRLEGKVEGMPGEGPGMSRVTDLFQPDTTLSFQYFELLRRKIYLEGEKKLLFAVLEDAVNCFQKQVAARNRRGKRLFGEAEEWIMHGNDEGVFSFNVVCELLELSPDYLRRGLLRWKHKQEASRCLFVKAKGRQNNTDEAKRYERNRRNGVKDHGKVSGLWR
jgi:hypothetical protein